MRSQWEIETVIKSLDGGEYIGYISFAEPFQNIYCEISESKHKLEHSLAKKLEELQKHLHPNELSIST